MRSLLESVDAEFSADYEADVTFDVRVSTAEGSAFLDRVHSATSGRADIDTDRYPNTSCRRLYYLRVELKSAAVCWFPAEAEGFTGRRVTAVLSIV